MANNCLLLQRLEEAMSRFWFHHNILASSEQRGPGILMEVGAVAASEDKSGQKGRLGSCRHRSTRLNTITSDELFKMPPAPPTASRHQLPSLPSSADNSPQARSTSKRRPAKVMRSCKSFSEPTQEELREFVDLGLVFQQQSLSPHMMSVLPGLQRLGKKTDEKLGWEDCKEKGRVRRPYLAEAWLIRSYDSPRFNLKMLTANFQDSAAVKRQLRVWARTVASTIHQ